MREAQRICLEEVYTTKQPHTEAHHWQPKCLGGTDYKSNIFHISTENHFKVHLALYYHFKEVCDEYTMGKMASACWMMSGVSKRVMCTTEEYVEIRREHKISAAKEMSKTMKGMMPAKDKGGNIVHINTNDPRVFSGELKHHSVGMSTYWNPDSNEKVYCIIEDKPEGWIGTEPGYGVGNKNNNVYDLSIDKILEMSLVVILKHGRIRKPGIIRQLIIDEYDIKIPSDGLGYRVKEPKKYLIKWLENQTGWKYEPYFRSTEQREKISKTLKEKNVKN